MSQGYCCHQSRQGNVGGASREYLPPPLIWLLKLKNFTSCRYIENLEKNRKVESPERFGRQGCWGEGASTTATTCWGEAMSKARGTMGSCPASASYSIRLRFVQRQGSYLIVMTYESSQPVLAVDYVLTTMLVSVLLFPFNRKGSS